MWASRRSARSVGARGYGQPILTGIRLNDTGLILQGAVPAACLAILLQLAFELVERRLAARRACGPIHRGRTMTSTH